MRSGGTLPAQIPRSLRAIQADIVGQGAALHQSPNGKHRGKAYPLVASMNARPVAGLMPVDDGMVGPSGADGSAPTPRLARYRSPFHTQRKIDAYHALLRDSATQYATLLGIPAVMANKSGPWETTFPSFWPGKVHSAFPGLSHIADSDGRELCCLGNEEGVIVADVILAPERKARHLPLERDKWKPWLHPVPLNFDYGLR